MLDPFMGSGSVGVAAVGRGRSFAGNDICDEAVDVANRRLVEAGAVPDQLFEARDPEAGMPPQLGLGFR